MKRLLCVGVMLLALGARAASGPSISGIGVSSNTVYSMIIRFAGSSTGVVVTVVQNFVTNSFFINNVTNNTLNVTNLTTLTTVNVSGKATFNSNAYFLNTYYKTNTMSTTTIDVNKTTSSLATNDAIVFTGYSNIDGTNVIPFSRIITNTAGSAAPKPITFPVGTQMLSSPYTNVVYNTNQGVFSGFIWPSFGTNATWTGN